MIPFPNQRPHAAAIPALAFAKPALTYLASNVVPVPLHGEQGAADLNVMVLMPSVSACWSMATRNTILIGRKELFQKTDCMNYSYFFKRAFYLACVASGLREDRSLGLDMKFCYQNDNPLQPMILASVRMSTPPCH